MAKTAAERKRESRARQSEEKKLAERDKARRGMKAMRVSRKYDEIYKKKHRLESQRGMKNMRQRRKDAKEKVVEEETMITCKSPFTTRQTFGKAMKRVSVALPSSPRKRLAVIKELTIRESSVQVLNAVTVDDIKKKSALPKETISAVKNFYRRDDISRQLSGKKEYKSIKNEAGEKEKVQKRLLMYTLKELHDLYKKENSGNPVGISKFCELRPEEVQLASTKNHRVCCCVYCENLSLLLTACEFNSGPKKIKELIEMIVCDRKSANCMRNTCELCGVSQLKRFVESETISWNDDESISFYQWKNGKLELVLVTYNQVKEMLMDQTKNILKHSYNIWRQAEELQKQKEDLSIGEIILQTDFAENYYIKHQDEVMQAHWNAAQGVSVTIYTAVIYFRQIASADIQTQCYAIISDANKHSAYEVNIFNEQIINDFTITCEINVESVILWTDGAAAHFKNRYSMMTLTSSNVYRSWNFTESYHGKGPHDGVGAVVKRNVWHRVLRGKAIVRNAKDFFLELEKMTMKTKCLFVSEIDMIGKKKDLKVLFENVNPVEGIQSSRCITNMGEFKLALYQNTGDDVPMHEVTLKENLETETDFTMNNFEVDSVSELSPETIASLGDFVIVEFVTVKSKQRYVGQVFDTDKNDYEVLFMKKNTEATFVFPTIEDKSWVGRTQIVKVLSQPTVNSRGHYHFTHKIDL